MQITELLFLIITVLLGAIGYFVKRILDKTEIIENKTDYIGRDVTEIKPKVKILWEREFATSASPLALNERGKQILKESGIKQIVDDNMESLLQKLNGLKPQNAYQAQECSTKVVRTLAKDPANVGKLQEGAFKTGVDVDTVLFAGAIYFRDVALKQYNFKLEDIDNEDPKEKK